MNFLHHLFSINKPTGFDKIEGYEDIKDIVIRALDSEDNYNLLFIGLRRTEGITASQV
jgi:hypothetical protein